MDTNKPELDRVGATEIAISTLLRAGVLISLALVVIGTTISFLHHPDYFTSHEKLTMLTTPGRAYVHTLHDMVVGVSQGRGESIVVLGLLLLIATPVFRVAVSIIAFALQKDRIFVVITAIVFALLILSFFLGKAEGG